MTPGMFCVGVVLGFLAGVVTMAVMFMARDQDDRPS